MRIHDLVRDTWTATENRYKVVGDHKHYFIVDLRDRSVIDLPNSDAGNYGAALNLIQNMCAEAVEKALRNAEYLRDDKV